MFSVTVTEPITVRDDIGYVSFADFIPCSVRQCVKYILKLWNNTFSNNQCIHLCIKSSRGTQLGWVEQIYKNGSIPRNACMACKTKQQCDLPEKCDYQENVTTGQTDAGQSDPYVPLCFAGNIKFLAKEQRNSIWNCPTVTSNACKITWFTVESLVPLDADVESEVSYILSCTQFCKFPICLFILYDVRKLWPWKVCPYPWSKYYNAVVCIQAVMSKTVLTPLVVI